MASLRYLTGDPAYYNLLARAALTSVNADDLFPLSYLADGVPGNPFKFGPVDALDGWIKGDLTLVQNGSLDAFTGSTPTDWASLNSGTGTTAADAAIMVSGNSLRANAGASGVAGARQDVIVRAGQKVQVKARVRSDSGSGTSRIRIQNLQTGAYLTNASTWQAAAVDSISVANNGTFDAFTRTLQVQDFATAMADTVTLRIECYTTDNADAWFDNVYLTPTVDFLSVHGHNLSPAQAPVVLAYSDDDSTYTTALTIPTLTKPTFYAVLGAVEYHRWWRMAYTGWPIIKPWYGEVVLGQASTAIANTRLNYEISFIRRQARNVGRGGEVRVYPESLFDERTLRLSFGMQSAFFAEIRDEWFRRSEGGRFPMVVIPRDDEPLVIQGRIDNRWSVRRRIPELHEGDLVIVESPLPSVVA